MAPASSWLMFAARKLRWRKGGTRAAASSRAARSRRRRSAAGPSPRAPPPSKELPSPASWPWLRPKTSAAIPTPERDGARPVDLAGGAGRLQVGVARRVSSTVAIASGTFIRNTRRQSIVVKSPPSTGSRAAKKADARARIPSAWPRFAWWKDRVHDREGGRHHQRIAPAPWGDPGRDTASWHVLGKPSLAGEQTKNTKKLRARKTRRKPEQVAEAAAQKYHQRRPAGARSPSESTGPLPRAPVRGRR